MIKKILDKPEIYQIYVPLPDNPLKSLNCYVVKTDEGNLVIDTGFNRFECFEVLSEGLKKLKIDMDRTTLFLTHLHSDHVGLTNMISTEKTRVLMNAIDYDYLEDNLIGANFEFMENLFKKEGFPKTEVDAQIKINQGRIYAPDTLFNVEKIIDGSMFNVGDLAFECIHTPGHTPGHTCLYLKKEKIMFVGDHVLFNITPNITAWKGIKDSLADYLNSLDKLANYDMKLIFTGHRENGQDVYERIEEIKKHHEKRLSETFEIVKKKNSQNAYQIASQLKWSMRGKDWTEFPIQQKWFAVGETLSHLDYLIHKGLISKTEISGGFIYQTTY